MCKSQYGWKTCPSDEVQPYFFCQDCYTRAAAHQLWNHCKQDRNHTHTHTHLSDLHQTGQRSPRRTQAMTAWLHPSHSGKTSTKRTEVVMATAQDRTSCHGKHHIKPLLTWTNVHWFCSSLSRTWSRVMWLCYQIWICVTANEKKRARSAVEVKKDVKWTFTRLGSLPNTCRKLSEETFHFLHIKLRRNEFPAETLWESHRNSDVCLTSSQPAPRDDLTWCKIRLMWSVWVQPCSQEYSLCVHTNITR